MTKLFAANLPHTTTAAEIAELFRKFGEIRELEIIRDWNGGFRGYLFLVMDDKAAQAAIDALDGSWFAGRKISVKRDDHKATRSQGRINFVSDDGSYGRIKTDAGDTVYMPRGQYCGAWDGGNLIGRKVIFEVSTGMNGRPVARDVRPTEKMRQQLT